VSVVPIPSSPADLELIEKLQRQLQYALLKIQLLEERLHLLRLEKYGASGEKLSDAQLELFKLDLGNPETAPSEPGPQGAIRHKSIPHKHPGRQELPAHLPRIERVLACPPDRRLCKKCGKEMIVIGYEESCQLDVLPAKYFVLVTKREKRACKACEEQGVFEAPLPSRIIDKSLASDSVVIDTIIRKYCDHSPLHRQSAILQR